MFEHHSRSITLAGVYFATVFEDARLRAHYAKVDKRLVDDEHTSVELAIDRLMKHPKLGRNCSPPERARTTERQNLAKSTVPMPTSSVKLTS